RGNQASAQDRPGSGGSLSGAARPGLSGRLHPLAGPVAQAAGRALGRPGTERGASPGRGARAGDRGIQGQEYWSIDADLAADGAAFQARLIQLDGKKIDKLSLASQADADHAVAAIKAQSFKIGSVEAKPVKRNPSPPFKTSTLQQEAARKLGFNAKRTMQVAQGLYEGVEIGGDTTGLITYMRTDGITMVPEAVGEARQVIAARYGQRYVPGAARVYVNNSSTAQEAHEA